MSSLHLSVGFSEVIRPCKCGCTPVMKYGQRGRVHTIQLRCACGAHGALLMYTKPQDATFMAQAAVDGWNMAD